jgi:hypothetical protein
VSTSQEISAPPSIALAQMAKKLADMRYYGCPSGDFALQSREWAADSNGLTLGASGEFYRILDRISCGEAP